MSFMWSVRNSGAAEADLSAVFQQMGVKPEHHVRFGEEALVAPKDNNVIVQKISSDCLAVHLGFLQVGHRYNIRVHLPHDMWPGGQLMGLPPEDDCNSRFFNPNCRLLSISQCEDGGWNLIVEYFAHKEKLMKEDLILLASDENHNINFKLTFHARVLGRGKGTPLLRNGIHSVGVELEDEGETSDWQGFE